MTELVRYEAAKRALAEAHRVDEVKDIRDKAVAMQHYARQAKDTDLIDKATEIRLRAERRAGELLRDVGERRGGDQTTSERSLPTNKEMGITDNQSSRWQRLADLDDDDFEGRVATAKREAARSLEATAAERAAEKRERRDGRESELSAKLSALPSKKYGVILADPEWRWEPWSRETGMDRSADNHYPTSELEAIKTRDVPSIAADDCVLFLWATPPMLPQALEVMQAWGFAYKSQAIWDKCKIGTGYWFRTRHEILLVGTRGAIPAPAMGTQYDSIVTEPASEHSRKPELSYRMIEHYFPTLPKIELNARCRRPGWDAWGNEVAA
jgi:N6-adenosine-specific RNA methylase IME4